MSFPCQELSVHPQDPLVFQRKIFGRPVIPSRVLLLLITVCPWQSLIHIYIFPWSFPRHSAGHLVGSDFCNRRRFFGLSATRIHIKRWFLQRFNRQPQGQSNKGYWISKFLHNHTVWLQMAAAHCNPCTMLGNESSYATRNSVGSSRSCSLQPDECCQSSHVHQTGCDQTDCDFKMVYQGIRKFLHV